MPWVPPDSVDSYARLLQAIDRPRMAVHFDPANLCNSPRAYYANGALIREFCARLGPHIRSGHAKDLRLTGPLTVHIDEVRPGTGELDYRVLLSELNKLDPDLPLMIEHLSNEAEYDLAAQHIRGVAAEIDVAL